MIARPFVTQSAIDDDEVWRLSCSNNLARRCDAQQEAATGCKQLFSDQHCEWRAYGTSDDPNRPLAQCEHIKRGMIAGPGFKWLRLRRFPELADNVAIRIKDTNRGHCDVGQLLLPTGLTQ